MKFPPYLELEREAADSKKITACFVAAFLLTVILFLCGCQAQRVARVTPLPYVQQPNVIWAGPTKVSPTNVIIGGWTSCPLMGNSDLFFLAPVTNTITFILSQ